MKFKYKGRVDGVMGGTVEIDPKLGIVRVKPKRRHREYILTLTYVAELIITKVIKEEVSK